jgi:hypothetical protein
MSSRRKNRERPTGAGKRRRNLVAALAKGGDTAEK